MRFLEIGESMLSPNDKCIAPLLLGGIIAAGAYRDWETDRKSTRLNSSHSGESRMPSSA